MGSDYYYELLVKYMRYVRECEGIDFITEGKHPSVASTFTDDEWSALQQAAGEAQQTFDQIVVDPTVYANVTHELKKPAVGSVVSLDFESAYDKYFSTPVCTEQQVMAELFGKFEPELSPPPPTYLPEYVHTDPTSGAGARKAPSEPSFMDLLERTLHAPEGDEHYEDNDANPLETLPIGAPHPETPYLEKYVTGIGQLMWVHAATECVSPNACSIHNPTDPHQDWPTMWDWPYHRMMRVCPHGYEHPDKDHLAHVAYAYGPWHAAKHAEHTCCPTCKPECTAVIG